MDGCHRFTGFNEAVAIDNAGNIYLAGGAGGYLGQGTLGDRHLWLAKYDGLTGTQQSFQQLGTVSGPDEGLNQIVFDKAGNLYTLRETNGSNSEVIKYNSNGMREWLLPSFTENVYTIGIDSAGDIYAAGGKSMTAPNDWVAKYLPVSNFF